MPIEISSNGLADVLMRVGAFNLDFTLALSTALHERGIDGDFLRFSGTSHGKMALDEVMARLAYTYQVSIAGASKLFAFLRDPGEFPGYDVPGDFQFDPGTLEDAGVVEMTASFREYFPAHRVPARPSQRISPYALQCAAPFTDVILACGMRPYADCHMLSLLLGDAHHDAAWTPLLTARSNLFCMLNVFDEPCIVESWNHHGWHLDAFRLGDHAPLFEPGYRLFVPIGVREKKFV